MFPYICHHFSRTLSILHCSWKPSISFCFSAAEGVLKTIINIFVNKNGTHFSYNMSNIKKITCHIKLICLYNYNQSHYIQIKDYLLTIKMTNMRN